MRGLGLDDALRGQPVQQHDVGIGHGLQPAHCHQLRRTGAAAHQGHALAGGGHDRDRHGSVGFTEPQQQPLPRGAIADHDDESRCPASQGLLGSGLVAGCLARLGRGAGTSTGGTSRTGDRADLGAGGAQAPGRAGVLVGAEQQEANAVHRGVEKHVISLERQAGRLVHAPAECGSALGAHRDAGPGDQHRPAPLNRLNGADTGSA